VRDSRPDRLLVSVLAGHLPGRPLLVRIALAIIIAVVCPASSAPEDELKSAAVLSFLRYSEWPVTPDGTITVGVFGRAAFTQALDHTLEGKVINNRPVHLVPIGLASDLHGFQLVYVAASKAADVRQILSSTAAVHALAIGETDRFLDYGGAINLFLIDGHIGFEVSLETLDRSGVTISSRMLRLGQIRDQHHGRPAP
jgi:hypothetical protein